MCRSVASIVSFSSLSRQQNKQCLATIFGRRESSDIGYRLQGVLAVGVNEDRQECVQHHRRPIAENDLRHSSDFGSIRCQPYFVNNALYCSFALQKCTLAVSNASNDLLRVGEALILNDTSMVK
jgi:hypothetical protein